MTNLFRQRRAEQLAARLRSGTYANAARSAGVRRILIVLDVSQVGDRPLVRDHGLQRRTSRNYATLQERFPAR